MRVTAREGRSLPAVRRALTNVCGHVVDLLMQRTVCCKISPTAAQTAALRAAMKRFALGQTLAAVVARDARCGRAYDLHHLCYRQLREDTGLGANMACIAIRRVAGAYETLRTRGVPKPSAPWPTLSFSGEGGCASTPAPSP